ncbi:MAG: hypothetical protein ACTSRL_17860 [Candidatus Helarchaeota archaeon]
MDETSKRRNWLRWWGLKSDPWIDIPLTKKEYVEKFLIKTFNVEIIESEIDNLENLDIGYIKLIIGARGTGKTSMSYYLYSNFEDKEDFISVFVDTKDYIPFISETSLAPSWAIRQFIIVSGIKELISLSKKQAKLNFLKEDLMKLEEYLTKLGVSQGDFNKELQIYSLKNLEEIFNRIYIEKKRILFIIDNLDKLTSPEEIHYVTNYFSKDQGLLQKLVTNFKANIIITCASEWLEYFRDPDLSYLNIEGGISLRRLDFPETKKIIKNRLQIDKNKKENFQFPFTDNAIRQILSYAQGNPRTIIRYCKLLMLYGAQKGIKSIGANEVTELLGEKLSKQYEEDFLIAVSSQVEKTGATSLWRLFKYIDQVESIKVDTISNLINGLYNYKKIKPSDQVLKIMLSKNVIQYSTEKKIKNGKEIITKEDIKLNLNVRKFLDKWVSLRHRVYEFLNWYPLNLIKPPDIPQVEDDFKAINDDLNNDEAREWLENAKDAYYDMSMSLDRPSSESIKNAWSCFEFIVKAMVYNYLDESVRTKRILDLLFLALRKLNISFYQLEFVKQLKKDRDRYSSGHYREWLPPDQIKARIKISKSAFEELCTKWGNNSRNIPSYSLCNPECRFFICPNLIYNRKNKGWDCSSIRGKCLGRKFSKQVTQRDCLMIECNAPQHKRCKHAGKIFD